MNLLNAFSDESATRRLFTWQTRNGMAPAFGSRPIGWYQQHQCAAYDYLKARCQALYADASTLRVKRGMVQGRRVDGGQWIDLADTREVFDNADKICRGYVTI